MSIRKALEWGHQRRGFFRIDDEATKGGTIGENIYNEDGSLFVPEEIVTEIIEENTPSNPGIASTLWRLILEIPANIVSLAALTGIGFSTRISATGDWANRTITGTFGRIEVKSGNGVGDELNVTLNSSADVTLNLDGVASLNSGFGVFLNSGEPVTLNLDGFATLNEISDGNPVINLGPWPTVQNSIGSGLEYEIPLGEQLIVYDSFDVVGTLIIEGDLVLL